MGFFRDVHRDRQLDRLSVCQAPAAVALQKSQVTNLLNPPKRPEESITQSRSTVLSQMKEAEKERANHTLSTGPSGATGLPATPDKLQWKQKPQSARHQTVGQGVN